MDVYVLPAFGMRIGDKAFDMKDIKVNIDRFFETQGVEDGALGMGFVSMFDCVTVNFAQMFVFAE